MNVPWLNKAATDLPADDATLRDAREIKAGIDRTAADLDAAGASVQDPIPPNQRPLGIGLSEQQRSEVEAHLRDVHTDAPDPEAETHAARKKLVEGILGAFKRGTE
jgi:hypothetical protein